LLITLVGYNVSRGVILDAQLNAGEKEREPYGCSIPEQKLPRLYYPKYYKKTGYGYCRGTEPVRYVSRIMTYYDILKKEKIIHNAEDLDSPGSNIQDVIANRYPKLISKLLQSCSITYC
jgi:membrane-bound lytic murein transglycosylase MltF